MKYIFETERLRLREFILGDVLFIVELLNSPGWIQFIGDRNIKSLQQAASYLENGPIKSYGANGFGLWMVESKENETAIGMCGLIKRDGLENPDIGFAFLPNYTARGYAYEIASATLLFAKDKLAIEKICAITVAGNLRSIRLLEKIGLKPVGPFRFEGSEEDLLLYET